MLFCDTSVVCQVSWFCNLLWLQIIPSDSVAFSFYVPITIEKASSWILIFVHMLWYPPLSLFWGILLLLLPFVPYHQSLFLCGSFNSHINLKICSLSKMKNILLLTLSSYTSTDLFLAPLHNQTSRKSYLLVLFPHCHSLV